MDISVVDIFIRSCIRMCLQLIMCFPLQWLTFFNSWINIVDMDNWVCMYLPGYVPVAVMVLYGCCIYPHLSYTGLGQAIFQSLFQ